VGDAAEQKHVDLQEPPSERLSPIVGDSEVGDPPTRLPEGEPVTNTDFGTENGEDHPDDRPTGSSADDGRRVLNRISLKVKSVYTSPVQKEKQLLDCLADLPGLQLDDPTSADFPEPELLTKVDVLRGERLLLITCIDNDLLFSAGCAVVEFLKIPRQHQKLLHFGRVMGVDSPDVHKLLTRRINPDGEAVVVVDASDDRAEPFVTSLFRETPSGLRLIRDEMGTRKLFLICLMGPEAVLHRVARTGTALASWAVSHFQYVLRRSFPEDHAELAQKIEEQKSHWRWSSDEGEFHRQITSLLAAKRLREVVEQGGASAPQEPQNVPEDPLHLAILYTTTFYPSLSPLDFSRVLTVVVGDQKVLVPETVNQKTRDGTFKPVQLQRQCRVVDVWLKAGDQALHECGVITSGGEKRSVVFADVGRRDPLRKHLNEHYGLYVQSRFTAAYEQGLLFEPSEQIARDLILLTIEMMGSYPGQLGVDWIISVISRASLNQGWERLTDLFRAVLREPDLSGVIEQAIDRLFDDARHSEILQLTQRLRFVPGFDFFPVAQRLINEGAEEIRNGATLLVHREIRQGGRAYPALRTLASWLPDPAMPVERYPKSAIAALRIAFVYILEATDGFDSIENGRWPSSFPLFAVTAESASGDLTLLVRLLLHPDLDRLVGDLLQFQVHAARYLPALIAEWTFFLFGDPSVIHGSAQDGEECGDDLLSPRRVWELLLESTFEATAGDREMQKHLLAEWEGLRTALAVLPSRSELHRGRAVRVEYAWKRDLVRRLIGEFRRLQRRL